MNCRHEGILEGASLLDQIDRQGIRQHALAKGAQQELEQEQEGERLVSRTENAVEGQTGVIINSNISVRKMMAMYILWCFAVNVNGNTD